jgi:hypothetical protein
MKLFFFDVLEFLKVFVEDKIEGRVTENKNKKKI